MRKLFIHIRILPMNLPAMEVNQYRKRKPMELEPCSREWINFHQDCCTTGKMQTVVFGVFEFAAFRLKSLQKLFTTPEDVPDARSCLLPRAASLTWQGHQHKISMRPAPHRRARALASRRCRTWFVRSACNVCPHFAWQVVGREGLLLLLLFNHSAKRCPWRFTLSCKACSNPTPLQESRWATDSEAGPLSPLQPLPMPLSLQGPREKAAADWGLVTATCLFPRQ